MKHKTPGVPGQKKQKAESPKAKSNRRLEFVPPVKPLKGKNIYLDLNGYKNRKDLENKLIEFGANIETCFSKDIKYLVTNQIDPKECRDDNRSPDSPSASTPSPFACIDSPGEGAHKEEGLLVSRGRKIAQHGRQKAGASSLITNARKFGVRIIHVTSVEKWVAGKSTGKSATNTPAKTPQKKLTPKDKKLRRPHLKFEHTSKHYRPVQKEFDSWPHISLEVPRGTCHFDGAAPPGGQDEYQEERADRGETEEEQQNSGSKQLSLAGPSKKQDTPDVDTGRIVTAGELRRLKEAKRKAEMKRGYCEHCQVHFDNMEKHIEDKYHKQIVRKPGAWRNLDLLINRGPNMERFLADVMKYHSEHLQEGLSGSDGTPPKKSKSPATKKGKGKTISSPKTKSSPKGRVKRGQKDAVELHSPKASDLNKAKEDGNESAVLMENDVEKVDRKQGDADPKANALPTTEKTPISDEKEVDVQDAEVVNKEIVLNVDGSEEELSVPVVHYEGDDGQTSNKNGSGKNTSKSKASKDNEKDESILSSPSTRDRSGVSTRKRKRHSVGNVSFADQVQNESPKKSKEIRVKGDQVQNESPKKSKDVRVKGKGGRVTKEKQKDTDNKSELAGNETPKDWPKEASTSQDNLNGKASQSKKESVEESKKSPKKKGKKKERSKENAKPDSVTQDGEKSKKSSKVDKRKIQLKQTWRVLSDRSALKLLSSEEDDFHGFGSSVDLPTDVTYVDLSQIEDDSDVEWVFTDEETDELRVHALGLEVSAVLEGSDLSDQWVEQCESFLEDRINQIQQPAKHENIMCVPPPERKKRRWSWENSEPVVNKKASKLFIPSPSKFKPMVNRKNILHVVEEERIDTDCDNVTTMQDSKPQGDANMSAQKSNANAQSKQSTLPQDAETERENTLNTDNESENLETKPTPALGVELNKNNSSNVLHKEMPKSHQRKDGSNLWSDSVDEEDILLLTPNAKTRNRTSTPQKKEDLQNAKKQRTSTPNKQGSSRKNNNARQNRKSQLKDVSKLQTNQKSAVQNLTDFVLSETEVPAVQDLLIKSSPDMLKSKAEHCKDFESQSDVVSVNSTATTVPDPEWKRLKKAYGIGTKDTNKQDLQSETPKKRSRRLNSDAANKAPALEPGPEKEVGMRTPRKAQNKSPRKSTHGNKCGKIPGTGAVEKDNSVTNLNISTDEVVEYNDNEVSFNFNSPQHRNKYFSPLRSTDPNVLQGIPKSNKEKRRTITELFGNTEKRRKLSEGSAVLVSRILKTPAVKEKRILKSKSGREKLYQVFPGRRYIKRFSSGKRTVVVSKMLVSPKKVKLIHKDRTTEKEEVLKHGELNYKNWKYSKLQNARISPQKSMSILPTTPEKRNLSHSSFSSPSPLRSNSKTPRKKLSEIYQDMTSPKSGSRSKKSSKICQKSPKKSPLKKQDSKKMRSKQISSPSSNKKASQSPRNAKKLHSKNKMSVKSPRKGVKSPRKNKSPIVRQKTLQQQRREKVYDFDDQDNDFML